MRRTKPPQAGCRGFSLVEMLIAVTVLALLGTVIVRVFLSSDTMNRKAAELDKAVSLCVDAVERLKAENPVEPINMELLRRVFPEASVESSVQIDTAAAGWSIRLLLDESWKAFSPARSDVPAHTLELRVFPDQETSGETSMVTATLFRMVNKGDKAYSQGDKANSPGGVATADPQEGGAWVSSWNAETVFSLTAALPAISTVREVEP